MPYFTPDDLIEHFAAYNDAIRRVAIETGAILIEGELDIPGGATHFVDSIHFTDRGSEMMAQRVFDRLVAANLF
jgi:hypothetical protein